MPFVLVTAGLIMIVTGARNTHAAFGRQLTNDLTGAGNFLYWAASLGAVGAVGYIPPLKKFSVAFMVLILLGLLLSHGGFFEKLQAAMRQGPVAPAPAPAPAAKAPGQAPGQSLAAWAAGNALESAGVVGPTGDNMVSRFLDWASAPLNMGK